MLNLYDKKILIIDFGSQYTQLIARQIRALGVYCEICACDADPQFIQHYAPQGIILSGGPETVTAVHTPRAPEVIFSLSCPILGICYGMQTMAAQLGGEVEASTKKEFGYAQLKIKNQSALFADIVDESDEQGMYLDVWMSHGDKVTQLPPGFACIASTDSAEIAAMADEKRKLYAVQFHPEVTHTKQGKRMLAHFVYDICALENTWTTPHIVEERVAHIKATVGSDQVLLALSGGVDSAVLAALLHKAIGEQLTCVFVDTGLLRLNEAEEVMQLFSAHLGIRVIRVDAEKEFLTALAGITEPEEKRRIIGHVFIDVFEETAKKFTGLRWLAQGTIYPDVIESAASAHGKAHLIKSHHNVGGLPERLPFKLLEPLRELFKDEVRALGLFLGLPEAFILRHPFPGPGLAVRVMGALSETALTTLRQADAIFIQALKVENLYDSVAQAFAVWLPVCSVGVVGDARQYAPIIALRAVETVDFMTARWARLPYEFLERVANTIVNEVSGVSRVVYDISGKPPATIEWE